MAENIFEELNKKLEECETELRKIKRGKSDLLRKILNDLYLPLETRFLAWYRHKACHEATYVVYLRDTCPHFWAHIKDREHDRYRTYDIFDDYFMQVLVGKLQEDEDKDEPVTKEELKILEELMTANVDSYIWDW